MQDGGNILIVDDEPNALKVLSAILSSEGYNVYGSPDVDKAVNIMNGNQMDAVITDLRMPGRDGMQLFEYIRKNHPDIPVIFLTAYGTVESAVNTITNGAYYYFIKPPDYPKLKGVLSKAVEERRVKVYRKSSDMGVEGIRVRIFGNTREMKKIFETIGIIKDTSSSVVITGETGTGKELIAKALHYQSRRRQKPFVAVNCAAIPRELIESELFGFERGAFTSAVSRRVGRFEEASGGTIFLDEIGEIEHGLQAKLLRVLQEKEVERLGSNKKYKVDFRLVASTNRDLEEEVREGRFRKDLFYRINVVQIKVPPLRERPDDIPVLMEEFLAEFCDREQKKLCVRAEAVEKLKQYSWPGNIRQLKNVLERAVVLSKSCEIGIRELPEEIVNACSAAVGAAAEPEQTGPEQAGTGPKTLKEMEFQAIRNALDECGGNISRAAKLLGISRKTFYKRLREES